MEEKKIFINLSNHPSCGWSDRQMEAAQKLGEIYDLCFPAVEESGSENDILELAEDYVNKIRNISDNSTKGTTVHVMGEMTFTYAIVNRLTDMGYTCVASTTSRIVEIGENGEKKSYFVFNRFRRYVSGNAEEIQ